MGTASFYNAKKSKCEQSLLRMRGINMFPWTQHTEAVVRIERG